MFNLEELIVKCRGHMKVFGSIFLVLTPLLSLPVVLNSKKPIWFDGILESIFERSSDIDLTNIKVPTNYYPTETCGYRLNCFSTETIEKLIKKIEESKNKSKG